MRDKWTMLALLTLYLWGSQGASIIRLTAVRSRLKAYTFETAEKITAQWSALFDFLRRSRVMKFSRKYGILSQSVIPLSLHSTHSQPHTKVQSSELRNASSFLWKTLHYVCLQIWKCKSHHYWIESPFINVRIYLSIHKIIKMRN